MATLVNSHYAGAFHSYILFCACHSKQRYSYCGDFVRVGLPLSAIFSSLKPSRLSQQFIKSLHPGKDRRHPGISHPTVLQNSYPWWHPHAHHINFSHSVTVTFNLTLRASVWVCLTHRSAENSVVHSFPVFVNCARHICGIPSP